MDDRNIYCYACTEIATTREHVPPKSFFPVSRRDGIFTVPSCEKHNNENGLDVEYVGNILVSHFETNEEIRELLNPKVWRSYDRRPALLKTAFGQVEEVLYQGQVTGTFTVDWKRVHRVMSAIASGMYFLTCKQRFYGSWEIFSPSTYQASEIKTGKPSEYQIVRDMLPRLGLQSIETSQPSVFSCGINFEDPHRLVFMFQFFSGIKIYALAVPFWRNPTYAKK